MLATHCDFDCTVQYNTPMKNFELVSDYQPQGDQPQAIRALIEGLKDGEAFQTLLGATGTGKTFTIANVIQDQQRPTLIMAPNKTLAAQLYSEMRDFFPGNSVEYFVSYYDYYQPEAYVPSSDTYIEKDASINEYIDQMRLSATKALLERPDVIIVATVSAIYGLGDPAVYHDMVMHLKEGGVMEQRDILRRLAELQYTRNNVELHRGNFRVRGDVIDIYPAESDREAVRIELFGDEIERLTLFDPLTGETDDTINRYTIYPKSHYVTAKERLLNAIDDIKSELRDRLKVLRDDERLLEAQRLEQRTVFDIEMMQELGYCNGIENYSRYLSGREAGQAPPTLIDYLPSNSLLVLDESHVGVPQIGAMYKGDRSRKGTLVEYGFRLPSALDNRPLKMEEFESMMPQTIFVSATPGPYEMEHSGDPIDQVVRPTGLIDPQIIIRPVLSQVDDVLSEINIRTELNERVLITTLTKRMSEDLTDYLHDHGVKVRYLHSDIDTVERVEIIRDLRLGVFDVLVGINLLREGLDIPEVSLVAILDADKEGFLRSTRSLIQTVGRAARNVKGTAILYADRITNSIKATIDETDRRREKQIAYNKVNGITPKTIQKEVRELIDGIVKTGNQRKKGKNKILKAIKVDEDYSLMSNSELSRLMAKLEKKMYAHAENLEFEEAALLRDEIDVVKENIIGV